MKLIIDRFEGSYAVCEKEDRSVTNIERSKLPESAKEGDVLILKDGKFTVDEAETAARRKSIRKKMEDLWI